MVTAELGVDVGEVGVRAGRQLLLPHVTRQLGKDVARLAELTIVAQRI